MVRQWLGGDHEYGFQTADVNCWSVTGDVFCSPQQQPQHCYVLFHNINDTLLPPLALSVGTGHESSTAELLNRNIIPRILGYILKVLSWCPITKSIHNSCVSHF